MGSVTPSTRCRSRYAASLVQWPVLSDCLQARFIFYRTDLFVSREGPVNFPGPLMCNLRIFGYTTDVGTWASIRNWAVKMYLTCGTCLSASSLPEMPQWPGIHWMKRDGLTVFSFINWIKVRGRGGESGEQRLNLSIRQDSSFLARPAFMD